MADRRITAIYITSGISMKTHDGFCMVEVTLEDGTKAVAQMPPEDVRKTAHDWLEAAEGAVHDAAVFKLLTAKASPGMALDEGRAAHFIALLREYRQDADQMEESPDVGADQRSGLVARTTDQGE